MAGLVDGIVVDIESVVFGFGWYSRMRIRFLFVATRKKRRTAFLRTFFMIGREEHLKNFMPILDFLIPIFCRKIVKNFSEKQYLAEK